MPRGRPRSFDIEQAIETAMLVFWSKGYEGTTIPGLTEAIGINRPSLYAAFGSKEDLFRLALDRYRKDPASYVNRAVAKPTAYEVMASLLEGVVDLVTDPKRPGGCLFVCGTHALSPRDSGIHKELAARRIAGEKDIRKRFEQAARSDDLPENSDPKLLAKLAATLIWGISIQAANGSTRAELKKLAAMTLESLRGRLQR
jgi:AcrR family transcriptional regulator